MAFRRRRFKSRRARKFRRRFLGKRRRFNVRRMLRRRPLIPELKYSDYAHPTRTIAVGTNIGYNLTPLQIAQNSSSTGRVGQACKFRKVRMRLNFLTSVTPASDTSFLGRDNWLRIVIWAPRTNLAHAVTYMGGVGIATNIDWNVATVLVDKMVRLGARTSLVLDNTGTRIQTVANPGPASSRYLFRKTLPFIRNVSFVTNQGSNNLDLDPVKDVLYINFINNSTQFDIEYNGDVRVIFVDA